MSRASAPAPQAASPGLSSLAMVVSEELAQRVREGARRMIAAMLEVEGDEFRQRTPYQRTGEARGYPNGCAPERTIGVGGGAIPLRQPRVSDVPAEVTLAGVHSQIVPRYQRLSASAQPLLSRLSLEGGARGDFEPVFRSLLGDTAPLSPSSSLRLKADWQAEFTTWQKRRVAQERSLACWGEGIYLAVGQEDEKTVLLSILGLRADGQKELLALSVGSPESAESWATVLRDLRERGMRPPLLGGVGKAVVSRLSSMRQATPGVAFRLPKSGSCLLKQSLPPRPSRIPSNR